MLKQALALLLMLGGVISFTEVRAREPNLQIPKPLQEQRTLDLNGKFGLGFVQVPLNITGLSLNFGMNSNLFSEVIIGGSFRTPSEGKPDVKLAAALGLHLQLFQTKTQVALTIGTRLHVNLGEECKTEATICATHQTSTPLVAHYLVDLPIRIYWFPTPHISLHTELGLSVRWGRGGASSNGTMIDGYSVELFNNQERIGSIGFTFWFPNSLE